MHVLNTSLKERRELVAVRYCDTLRQRMANDKPVCTDQAAQSDSSTWPAAPSHRLLSQWRTGSQSGDSGANRSYRISQTQRSLTMSDSPNPHIGYDRPEARLTKVADRSDAYRRRSYGGQYSMEHE